MFARKVISVGLLAVATIGSVALFPQRAPAIPLFARQFEISCSKCHSVAPKLNAFGLRFRQLGYHLPGLSPDKVFPLGLRAGLTYTSEPDPNGFSKLVVDELVLDSGGQIGPRLSYYVHQHVVDGGTPGGLRQAYLSYFLTPVVARVPMRLSFGSYELPTPVSSEEFRESVNGYGIFNQAIGSNPFTLGGPKMGLRLQGGDTTRGTSVELLALRGSEQLSGLQPDGTDTMIEIQHVVGPVTPSVYQYNGKRPDGTVQDEFHRVGYGFSYIKGRWESDNILQHGWDSSVDGAGAGATSSGGFSQLRYAFDPKLFGLVRYDGTNDLNGFSRATTVLLGYRLKLNMRLTVEDVITDVPTAKHTLNIKYLIAL